MKKIISLIFIFIISVFISACSSLGNLCGYWEYEKPLPTSGYEIFIITENAIGRNELDLKSVTFTEEKNMWVTSEYQNVSGNSLKYAFRIIDTNTIKAFTWLTENQQDKIIFRGLYKRISKEEAEKRIRTQSMGREAY